LGKYYDNIEPTNLWVQNNICLVKLTGTYVREELIMDIQRV